MTLDASDPADLSERLKAHEKYVLCVKGGIRANLKFLKAPGINLCGRRLDNIELSGADLRGADLRRANLSRASLYGAILVRANLSHAILSGADLRGTHIEGANFEFADMTDADFRQATIAVIDQAGRWTALGPEKGGRFVSFANCSLKGAKLNNANLKNAKFDGALLNQASFAGAILENATFDGAVLLGVNLKELRVDPARLQNSITDPSPELRARLPGYLAALESAQRWVETSGRDGSPANFEGEDIRLLAQHMKGRLLTGLNLKKTIAVSTDFTGCELQAAEFDGADLRGANFSGTDLRGASFASANLAHAKFDKANLLPLDLKSGASMPTVFDGAVLDGVSFHEARGRRASDAP